MSKVKGSGLECQAVMVQEWLRGATLRPRFAGTAERSHPAFEARGSSREEQPHVQEVVAEQAQEGPEELLHVQGQQGWP